MDLWKCNHYGQIRNRVDRVGLVKRFGKSMFAKIGVDTDKNEPSDFWNLVKYHSGVVSIVARATTRLLVETTTNQQHEVRLPITRCWTFDEEVSEYADVVTSGRNNDWRSPYEHQNCWIGHVITFWKYLLTIVSREKSNHKMLQEWPNHVTIIWDLIAVMLKSI